MKREDLEELIDTSVSTKIKDLEANAKFLESSPNISKEEVRRPSNNECYSLNEDNIMKSR